MIFCTVNSDLNDYCRVTDYFIGASRWCCITIDVARMILTNLYAMESQFGIFAYVGTRRCKSCLSNA